MDSDGYFTIKRNLSSQRSGYSVSPLYQERLGIKQVTPQAPELLKDTFGGGKVYLEKPSATNGKMLFVWLAADLAAAKVAEALVPFLRIKKRQAELLLLLREHKNRLGFGGGRDRVTQHEVKGRWGGTILRATGIHTPETLAYREALWREIKSLNDTRYPAAVD